MTSPSELTIRWRERGDELHPYAPSAAAAFHTAASELEDALLAYEDELLDPTASASESLSKRRLRELEAQGLLVNHGKKGAPRYRRGDLPTRSKGRGDTSGGFAVESHVAEIVGEASR